MTLPAPPSRTFEAVALNARRDEGLAASDPFRPVGIAYDLRVTLCSLSRFSARHGQLGLGMLSLLGRDAHSFIAALFPNGSGGLLIFNDGLEPAHYREGIAEEFSHVLLHHDLTPAFDRRRLRNHDAAKETPARRLAGALLVSPEAAFAVRRMGLSLSVAASRLGVRGSLLASRMHETGALLISPDPRVHAA